MVRTEVKRPKLYEEVSKLLEEMILDGSDRTGDVLPSERALMERFSVSRSAIREALFHLRMMGLAAIPPGARARTDRPAPWRGGRDPRRARADARGGRRTRP